MATDIFAKIGDIQGESTDAKHKDEIEVLSFSWGYRLELHGRYSHGRAYVERLLAGDGLAPEIVHADLRMESGKPVAGLVIRATKPS